MRAILETIDAHTGAVTQVLQSDMHLEAPNWTPDGRAMVVNAKGRLYRIPLDSGRLEPIDTSGLARLNNDHGLSPDGTLLAFCDKTETGESCIYTVPLAGGMPTRITAQVPSWWHGWSPDGTCMTYAAVREGQFCICSCVRQGGDERILVTSPHHYDGPDYSSDGEWIWFNSDRSGAMSLWRMRVDGSGLEQMTASDRDDWFPHPSPSGDVVCFLAYPPDTKGHPFGRQVSLCVMSAQGGPVRVLHRFFGGQGTLNAPCWAPDGRKFAYIRYDDVD